MNGTCSNISLCSTQFLSALNSAWSQKSEEKKLQWKTCFNFRSSTWLWRFLSKGNKKQHSLKELLLDLPPGLNCNFWIWIIGYLRVRKTDKQDKQVAEARGDQWKPEILIQCLWGKGEKWHAHWLLTWNAVVSTRIWDWSIQQNLTTSERANNFQNYKFTS